MFDLLQFHGTLPGDVLDALDFFIFVEDVPFLLLDGHQHFSYSLLIGYYEFRHAIFVCDGRLLMLNDL